MGKICKKCYARNSLRFTVGKYDTLRSFFHLNSSYHLELDVISYGLGPFCNCKGCLLNQNLLLHKNRFNGTQKYLSRGVVNTKQTNVQLGHKPRLNMMVSCVTSCWVQCLKEFIAFIYR